MLDKLKKRDCPISIKLTPSGVQFLTFEMDVEGDYFKFSPSSAVGEQFEAFLSALYGLFLDENGKEDCKREYLTNENHVIQTAITTLSWDGEGADIDILMSRKITNRPDCDSEQLSIEISSYGTVLKKYTVNTKDFCYAVAKACTEVLKEYGFYGYRYSTEYDYFKIHHLLYIKSFALGNFEAIELHSDDDSDICRTSFEKEMELLMFDM